jgi:hypothetical protein
MDHDSSIPKEIIEEFQKNMEFWMNKISYREINVESWYQELLEKDNRTTEEEFIFQVMDHTRGAFNKTEEDYWKKQSQNPWVNTEMSFRYCDWDGRPIYQWEYHFKHSYFPKHVAKDIINGWRISTVWLGLDHAFLKDGNPVVFETMIFKNDQTIADNEELNLYQERYSYLTEAEKGHKEACKRVKELTNVFDKKRC